MNWAISDLLRTLCVPTHTLSIFRPHLGAVSRFGSSPALARDCEVRGSGSDGARAGAFLPLVHRLGATRTARIGKNGRGRWPDINAFVRTGITNARTKSKSRQHCHARQEPTILKRSINLQGMFDKATEH